MNYRIIWLTPPAIIACASTAYAVQYFTVSEVQKFIFPTATSFEEESISLTEKESRGVELLSGVNNKLNLYKIWKARIGNEVIGYLIIDEVYGKHELITYALGLDKDGSILGLEIMDYRETRGGEIRNKNWRAQFLGKKSGDRLEVGESIENISGATISCQHITEGVQRLLALFKIYSEHKNV